MGSKHKALLIANGGGGKELQEFERQRYKNELNNFLKSQGVSDWSRASAQAHFDIGYDEGYSGEEPYYNSEWDEGV